MKNRKIKKLLARVLVTGILAAALTGNSVIAYAAVSEESAQDVQENNTSEETELKENSWRYENGEPIKNNRASRAATYPYAWEKVDGQYVNDRGEAIPGAQKKGIDVSEHNGTIDWNKVKADGIEFAIIRCGYGQDMVSQDDEQWEHNVSECERLGIPYGVYLYSYADTVEKAASEAQHVLRLLEGHNPTYPVYYDLEDRVTEALSASMKGQVAKTFCDAVSAAGYSVGIYSNLDWWTNKLTDPVFNNPNWSKWVAQWSSTCSYTGTYDIWQCSSEGRVDGIGNGQTDVDLNFMMSSPAPGAGTLQYDAATGTWNVYKNGSIDTSYTGLAENEYGWWYVTNGTIDWNYTGMAQNIYGWWYVTNGAIDWNYVGMAQNEYGWWYISNGTVDWNYVGMAENIYGWWYITNGTVDWNFQGMAQNIYGWWYMTGGAVDWNYVGMAQNDYGWWYISNGTVDWNYVGMAENPLGWWYIKNGTVDWNFTGMAQNQYGWWYLTNGGVDWNFIGMAQNIYGWWYISNGTVDWNYQGMAENIYGWWYISNGTVDWNFTGMAQNPYGWWYLTNGGVNWNFTGTIEQGGSIFNVVNGYAGS